MPIAVSSLTLNNRNCPLGIDSARPEFAWKVHGTAQEWFAIEVSLNSDFAPGNIVWRTGWRLDSAPFGHTYAGPDLTSATRY